MCAIVGYIGSDVEFALKKMLKTLSHRGPDGTGVWVDGKISYADLENLEVPSGFQGMGHNLLSIVGQKEVQPLVYEGRILICNGEIYNYQQLKEEIGDDLTTGSDCEVILRLYQNQNGLRDHMALEETLKKIEGDYALAIYDEGNIMLARDPLGVKPLYYALDQGRLHAFASERKALWALGIREVKTLPPGHILYQDKLIEFYKLPQVRRDAGGVITRKSFKRELSQAVIKAVEKRVKGVDKVGLFFSGGVDSTIIAQILLNHDIPTTLYTVGTLNSPDMEFAQHTAQKLGLNLRRCLVDEKVVRQILGPVITAIEEFNIMKIGVAMPLYLAAKMAASDGLRVVLSGQGADELFGGYHRYLRYYKERGRDVALNLREDVERIHEVNLERDDMVTMSQGVELRVPYLDEEVIRVAFNIPLEYKIEDEKDSLRKHILRDVARDLGVPAEIVNRPKKAAQYGSGIHKILIKKVLTSFDQEAFMKNLRGF